MGEKKGKKFSELENDEKRTIENSLEAKASELGLESWENYQEKGSLLEDQIGLCAGCKSLKYCKTEFGNVFAKCNEFEFNLTGQNRITECNMLTPKGTLSLADMYSLAYMIEPDIKPKIGGFISNDKKFKKLEKGKGFIS